MSRLLSRNSGRSQPTPTSEPERSSGSVSTTELVYEPLAFPLTEKARSLLGELSRSQNTPFKNQIRDSLRALGDSVSDLQDQLQYQRGKLHQLQTRREERGIESPEEERLASHIESLERQVDRLTNLTEAAVRDAIDQRVELEDNGKALEDVYAAATTNESSTSGAVTRRQRRITEAEEGDAEKDAGKVEDGDEIEQPPPNSIIDTFWESRTVKKDQYTSMSPYQRYGLDNEYISFKKMWHDGMSGADGPPLADASKWFRADGSAIMGSSIAELAQTGDGYGSDGDLAIAHESISLNCPLSLRPLEEPYSNRKCKHTFEKSAILDYLNGSSGPQQCPQTGCSESFKRSDFSTDFYLDQVILRKIQRARQVNEDCEMEDDFEDDVGDESLIPGPERTTGKRIKQELADRSKKDYE